jgi:hypothetical protein
LKLKIVLIQKNKELRPKHYTNSIDLTFGPVENVNSADDLAFSAVQGINVRRKLAIFLLWIMQK